MMKELIKKIPKKWVFIGVAALLTVTLTVVLICAIAGRRSEEPAKEEPTASESAVPDETQTEETPTAASEGPTARSEEPDETEETLETDTDNVNGGLNSPNLTSETPTEEILDLTALNPAEQYEAIAPIVLNYEDYVGKTLRVYGTYRIVNDRPHIHVSDDSGNYAWFELVYEGEPLQEGDPVTVEGTLAFYENEEGEDCPCIFVTELTAGDI